MLIKSTSGKIIYQSKQKTIRATLEEGVAKGVDFSFADLRQARLYGATLDGLIAVGAAFWGADLENTDIGLADLRNTDMRCANLKDTCLAESDLSGSDLRGAYFSHTIIEGAVLDRIKVSCPSFWELDLGGAHSVKEALYIHKGELEMIIDPARWVLQGADSRIVVNGSACLWRGRMYQGPLSNSLRKNLNSLHESIEKLLAADRSHIAKNSIPKRGNSPKNI